MKTITNKQKALVHVAKAKTGMTDPEYRGLLASVGVSSSRDLAPAKFDMVMAHFKTLGFKSRRPVLSSKDKLLFKLDKILSELSLTRKYADSIARTRFGVDLVAWCDAEQLHKIVAMMVYHQRRRAL